MSEKFLVLSQLFTTIAVGSAWALYGLLLWNHWKLTKRVAWLEDFIQRMEDSKP